MKKGSGITIAAILLFIFSLPVFPAAGTISGVQQDSLDNNISAIPLVNITGRLTSLNTEILEKRSNLLTAEEKRRIVSETDTLLFRMKLLREDPRIQTIDNLSFRNLSKLESEWIVLRTRLQLKEAELKEILMNRQDIIREMNELEKLWNATLINARKELSSEQLLNQIEKNIDILDLIRYNFREDSDFIQNRMVQVSNSLIFCNKVLSDISLSNSITGSHIFKMTQPPIWESIKMVRNDTIQIGTQRSVMMDVSYEIREFASDESFRIILHILIFFLLLVIITRSFKNLQVNIDLSNSSEMMTIYSIIRRPLSATMLLTFLSSYFIYNTLPNSIGFLNLVLLFLPVMFILYDIMPAQTRRYILLPSIAVLMAYGHSYNFSDNFFSRIFLILIDLFSIASVIFAIRKRTFRDNAPTERSGMILYYLALAGILMMFISLIGAVSGAVRLAEFITYATLKSVALVFIVYAINKTVNSLLYTIIHGRASENLKVLLIYRDIIYRSVSGFITIAAWIIWIILALKLFAVWDKVSGTINAVAGHNIQMGTTHFTLTSIIVFVLIIWLTIWLSRVIKIVIEGEIAPRVKMKRGVPGAVTLILRISLITMGFLFAVGAAGVEMDKLAILLGALGVGIGFGLQNIFNNLVSGIILAFERPIQEGDIIEVGTLWGTVKEIGIRSSVIFTFDGAEVMVPNGNLISNELINWTLTNQHRRVEAKVGVAYGTDPEKVLEILRKVSENEPDVLEEPASLALFSGFGDSSLDFKLLFWIANADRRMIVQSKVHVAINKAIKEAGIEIPFPQRDLHLRSVDPGIKIGEPVNKTPSDQVQ